jgi:Ras-related protein Rab-7A
MNLQIWDTSGQERFQSLSPSYYRGAGCCILVYDLTNTNSYESIPQWRDEFLNLAAPRDPDTFPFLLLGNKVEDVSQRRIRLGVADTWCVDNGNITHYEVSAKACISIEAAFLDMCHRALIRQKQHPEFAPTASMRLPQNGTVQQKPTCCSGLHTS